MNLFTGYIAQWKNYPDDEVKIRVARPSILSPSKELLHDFKENGISWDEYSTRFIEEIVNNPKARAKIYEILGLLKTTNVRLICYEKNPPCHRYILFDMINTLRWGSRLSSLKETPK